MRECPECGTRSTEAHGACPGCGKNLKDQTRDCPRCSETIAADAEACPACGHFLMDATCERHPDRPAEGQCTLCGRALCEDCEAGRKPYHLCDVHAEVPVIEGWAEVLSIPDEMEARLIEDNLRAEGVDSRMLSQKDHFAIPVEFGDLARVRVLVPAYSYLEAERIISAHRDSVGEVSFGCPNCGERYEEGEKVCAKCGEALV